MDSMQDWWSPLAVIHASTVLIRHFSTACPTPSPPPTPGHRYSHRARCHVVDLTLLHYLWKARRSLERDLDGVKDIDEEYPSDEPISVLLRSVREAAERLFPLLPLDRLSDYLVLSEATSAQLDEAAKVASHLLSVIEDLYLLCAGEKALEGERGSGVSLGRLRMLNSIFAEPSKEDRGHISFLEACLANPSTALAPSATYVALEDALRALLRIKPLESKLREGFLRSSIMKPVLNHGEERDLLLRIAAHLPSPVRSNRTIPDLTFPIGKPEGLPLFEMLTAPFIMLSGVETGELVLDTFNGAAESLLKSHTNGPLSGFRLFLPDKELVRSGSQSFQAAHWFQEVAAGLKAASAAASRTGSAVDASVAWLRGPGALHEVSLGEPVDEQETLLEALQEGPSSTGVPLVVVDMPSGTIFGADGHSWLASSTGIGNEFMETQRLAVVMRYVCFVASEVDERTARKPSRAAPMLLDHLFSLNQKSSQAEAANEEQDEGPEGKISAIRKAVGNTFSNISGDEQRVSDVDDIRLATLMQRIVRHSLIGTVVLSDDVPHSFIINDNLLFYVAKQVLEYNGGRGVSACAGLIHRCGMHLVIDIVPQRMVPPGSHGNKIYESAVHDFYQEQEKRMEASHLFSDVGVFSESIPQHTTLKWINNILTHPQVHLIQAESNTAHANVSVSRAGAMTPGEDGNVRKKSVSSRHNDDNWSTSFPDVWAVQVGVSDGDHSIVAPTQYLSPRICDLLVAIKAAVVVSSSGAATLAFPYITQDRLTLLKDMDRVHQPLTAAADLGIVELNRMADEAALEYCTQVREEEKRGDVVSLGYDMAVGRLTDGMETRSVKIPSLAKLLMRPRTPNEKEDATPISRNLPAVGLPSLLSAKGDSVASSNPRTTKTYAVGDTTSADGTNSRDTNHFFRHRDFSTTQSDSHSTPTFTLPVRVGSDEKAVYDTATYDIMRGDPDADQSYADLDSVQPNLSGEVDFAHVRILFLHVSPADPLIKWLISIGHSVTSVTDVIQMEGFLRCGIDLYDIVVIEWSSTIISAELEVLLKEARLSCHTVPIFFCLLSPESQSLHSTLPPFDDASTHPPLPDYANPPFIVRGIDMNDACLRNRALMRSHIRLGRILKNLRGDSSLHYQIKHKIGSGGFGDVYDVSMYASRGRLAMKRIPIGTITAERMEQLYKEATIMRELDHRNIVQLSHITCNDTHLHIFMELCDYALKDVMATVRSTLSIDPAAMDLLPHECLSEVPSPTRKYQRNNKSFASLNAFSTSISSKTTPQRQALAPRFVVRDVLGAVHYLHSQDIVHRDIKPQNILFMNGVAKLADFGSATTVSDRQKSLHTMKGTVPYMAPEVFLGEPYRKPCDIWSLGILIGDILGLRFAPTALLHFPALQAFYKTLDEDESMPVVITNYVSNSFQKHLSNELIEGVKSALLHAREVAKEERQLAANRVDGEAVAKRTIFAILVAPRGSRCSTSQHSLSASLVELLESMFNRNPDKRVTAEQVLEHPIANEKEWMPSMIAEVTRLTEEVCASSSVSEQKDNNISMEALNLSFSGGENDSDSGDDVL